MTELPGLLLGEQAPAFTLDDATGRLVRLAQFRGHRALLNFWSTTCVPCTGEMPLLQRALDGLTREARARHAAPPVILGIDATTESAAMIRQFGRQHGVHYTLLLDPRMEVTLLRYHVADIPTSVVLDAAGRIRFVHVGALTEQDVIRALTTAG
jgi:peroxiredoxin